MEIVSIEAEPLPKPTHEQFLRNANVRFLVFWRDEFRCVYCGASRVAVPKLQLNLDHVVPRSAGGQFSLDNLVTACAQCNAGKREARLPDKILAMIRTIMRQNNERFFELADREVRQRLEQELGRKLGRKQVIIRRSGEDFRVLQWDPINGMIYLQNIKAGTVVCIECEQGHGLVCEHDCPSDSDYQQLVSLFRTNGVDQEELIPDTDLIVPQQRIVYRSASPVAGTPNVFPEARRPPRPVVRSRRKSTLPDENKTIEIR